MKRILQKFSKGSILAYTLILLFIVLTASIGMFSASLTNLRSVSTNDQSMNAFQIADSGSQAVVAKIKKAGGSKVKNVFNDPSSCGGSTAVLSSPLFQGTYKVTFLDSDEKPLKCDDDISKITSIKSVGTYADTARAVEVAVAASGSGSGVTGGCRINGGYNFLHIIKTWGKGCKSTSGVTVTVGDECRGVADTGYACGPTYASGDPSDGSLNAFCWCVTQ